MKLEVIFNKANNDKETVFTMAVIPHKNIKMRIWNIPPRTATGPTALSCIKQKVKTPNQVCTKKSISLLVLPFYLHLWSAGGEGGEQFRWQDQIQDNLLLAWRTPSREQKEETQHQIVQQSPPVNQNKTSNVVRKILKKQDVFCCWRNEKAST